MRPSRALGGLFATVLCWFAGALFHVNGATYTSWRRAFVILSLASLVATIAAVVRPTRITTTRAVVAVAAVALVAVLVRIDTHRQSDALAWPGFVLACVALAALVVPRRAR